MNPNMVQQLTASIIAIVVILGTFIVVGYQVINGQPVNIPTDISLLIGAVMGSFLTHSAAANGARTAGVAAAQATAAAAAATLAGSQNVGIPSGPINPVG